MFWKITERADREREAAQERAFTSALSERCLGEKGETTGELERSSTWVDAEEVWKLVPASKKSRDERGQGNFPAQFEMHYIITIRYSIWSLRLSSVYIYVHMYLLHKPNYMYAMIYVYVYIEFFSVLIRTIGDVTLELTLSRDMQPKEEWEQYWKETIAKAPSRMSKCWIILSPQGMEDGKLR